MPINPKVATLLSQMTLQRASSVEEARLQFRQQVDYLTTLFPPPQVPTRDLSIDTSLGVLKARLYEPRPGSSHSFPVIFFHGGGWVLGDIPTYHSFASRLASVLERAVLSIDYTLAPEAKFPQPVMQCLEATRWAGEHCQEWGYSGAGVILAGDSAGGNLAAAVSQQMAADDPGCDIKAQLLFYPALDMVTETPSKKAFAHGYYLEEDSMQWFGEMYFRTPEDLTNPLASPGLCQDLRHQPPSLIITAEYDPLRDEGEAYARALEGAGVLVRLRRYDGMIHGFMSMPLLDESEEALQDTRNFLREVEG